MVPHANAIQQVAETDAGPTPEPMAGPTPRRWRRWFVGMVYTASLAIVLLAVIYGQARMPHLRDHPSSKKAGVVSAMAAWDGEWYVRIAAEGYFFSTARQSSIVFFPACPLLARVLMTTLRLPPDLSLIIVSNVFLLASMVLLDRYVRERQLWGGPGDRQTVATYAVLAMALFPTTFYFRMAYTETLLIFLMMLAMYGMRRNWPPLAIAAIIGAATATRSVGVTLFVPFALHLWRTTDRLGPFPGGSGPATLLGRYGRFVGRCCVWMPLGCWGLVLFMAYQQWAFGEPLAFVKGQVLWHDRAEPATRRERIVNLATLEPIRAVYTPGGQVYWRNRAPHHSALLNLNFANPIFFLGTAALVVLGGVRGWLDRSELAMGLLLLAIPYILQSNRMGMTSHARFAAVVYPAYIVLGHLLARLPQVLSASLLVCSGLLMGAYAALFSLWYFFF